MALNGLVLVSSVLDFGSQDFEHLRHDEACLNFLPTYAAIAHYHGLHPDRTLEEVSAPRPRSSPPGPTGSPSRGATGCPPTSAPRSSARWPGWRG